MPAKARITIPKRKCIRWFKIFFVNYKSYPSNRKKNEPRYILVYTYASCIFMCFSVHLLFYFFFRELLHIVLAVLLFFVLFHFYIIGTFFFCRQLSFDSSHLYSPWELFLFLKLYFHLGFMKLHIGTFYLWLVLL